MIIRSAIENDTAQLAELFLLSRQRAFTWESEDKFSKDDYEKSVEGEDVWVAEIDNKIVGFISIWMPEDFIHNLFVHPNWQNQGVGKQLLEFAKQAILGNIMTLKVLIKNKAACIFYEKQGWSIRSTHKDPVRGNYHLLEFDKATIP